MRLTSVESTNVSAVGYDQEQLRLVICFRSGVMYEYTNVSADVHAELMASESKGGYAAKHVTRNVLYPCRKLAPEEVDAILLTEADANESTMAD